MQACIMLACIMLLAASPATVRAETTIRVFIDDRELACEVPPQSQNGHLLVPLRALGEALGFEAQWDGTNQTAILEKDDHLISLTAGSSWASVNGSLVEIDTPMQIVNSRVLAPLRFIGENLGCTAEWRGDVQEVRIYTESALSTAAVDYITYCNLNEQTVPYQVDYPGDFIKSVAEPRLVSFASPDASALLTVTDTGNEGRLNISQCFADEYGQHKDTTIYQHLKSDEKWYVLAWTEAGQTVYSKTYYCGESVLNARFSYPADQDKQYHSIIERFLQSFIIDLNSQE